MPCFQIDVLITELLHLVFQRCDISLQRFWSSTKVGHCSHNSCSFDGSPHSSLIPVAQETSVSALDVSIDGHKLSQKLDVPPVDIIFLDLSEILLAFFVSIKWLEVMPQRLMRLELIICSLNTELCGPIVRSRVEFSLSQVLQLMQQVGSSLRIDIIRRSYAGVRRISPNILSQDDIDNVFNSESVSSFEVDFPCFEVILDKLKEGIDFKRQAFLI